jgi:hypothetical protein
MVGADGVVTEVGGAVVVGEVVMVGADGVVTEVGGAVVGAVVMVGAVGSGASPQAANRTASTIVDHRGKRLTLQASRIRRTPRRAVENIGRRLAT